MCNCRMPYLSMISLAIMPCIYDPYTCHTHAMGGGRMMPCAWYCTHGMALFGLPWGDHGHDGGATPSPFAII